MGCYVMTKGERIKSARETAGLTQEQLGRMCHTTKQTIYKYETGIVTNIPIDRLVSIAQALNVSAEYLAGWDNDILYSTAKEAVLSQEFNSLSEEDRIAALNSIKKQRPANGEALVKNLPEDIQNLIAICKNNPALASALLAVARQIETHSSVQE